MLCVKSSEDNNTHCGLHVQSRVVSILPPVLIIELLLGVPWNLMALWVFCRHLRSWNPNVVFLFSMALADFLLLVSLPFRIDYLFKQEDWKLGKVWCGINLFMLAANRSASMAFMTTVAVIRYFKVVHEYNRVNSMSVWHAAGIACFIWTLVILLHIPLLTNNLLYEHNNTCFCRSFNPVNNPPPGIVLHYIVYLSEFLLCLMILLFCSIRICLYLNRQQTNNKTKIRKAIGIILSIVVIFIICFCPGFATGLNALYLKCRGPKNCDNFRKNGELFVMSLGFTYLHSVLDPVIYGFCSSMFCEALIKSFHQCGISKFMRSNPGL